MSIGSQTTGKLSLAPNRLISFFLKLLRHLKARTSPGTSTLYNLYLSLIYLASRPLLKKYLPLFKGRASPPCLLSTPPSLPLPHHFAFLFLTLSSLKDITLTSKHFSLPPNILTTVASLSNKKMRDEFLLFQINNNLSYYL